MNFPTANSVVYYNEYGEPLGWDTYREEDSFDYYDESVTLYGDEEEIDPYDCEHENVGRIREIEHGEQGECDDCGYTVARNDAQVSWYA